MSATMGTTSGTGGAVVVGAIVLAAGSGQRFGSAKQFLELTDGERLVDRAVAVAAAVAGPVVVVLPPGVTWDGSPVFAWGPGGEDRSSSTRAGLCLLPAAVDVVLVHDAAHPLATVDQARIAVDAVRRGADAAVPFLEAVDVVKRRTPEGRLVTVGRAELGLSQVPVAFRRDALVRAQQRGGPCYEDSELLERVGGRVVAVPGDPGNIHVVDRRSLEVARILAQGAGPALGR